MKSLFAFPVILSLPALALAQGAIPPAHPAAVPVVSAPASTPTVDAAHAPKIYCGVPKHDFGVVDVGPDIVHLFKVRNRGRGELKITDVHTSCGCTAGVVSQNGVDKHPSATDPVVVPPGRSTIIKATYHTAGHNGKIDKIIYVGSNDPANSNFQLQISMNMVPEVDVQPNQLWIPDVKHGQSHPVTIKVLGKPATDLQVLSAESANHVVTVTSLTPLKDDQQNRTGASIVVDVPVTQVIGSFSDTINLKTNDPKKTDISVSVTGEVTGKVRWDRKNLYFQPNQQEPVTVTFTADDPGKFAIRHVESAKHLVRPSIIKSRTGGADQYSLVATVVKNIPKDSDGKDQILVYTNDDELSKISIDVQAGK